VFDPLWQYQLPLWVVIFGFLIVLLVPMEVGIRLGMRHKSIPHVEDEAHSDVAITAMLALLGLMLAFTYSFSMNRSDLPYFESDHFNGGGSHSIIECPIFFSLDAGNATAQSACNGAGSPAACNTESVSADR